MSTYAERLNQAMSHLGVSQSELARRVADITKSDKVKPQTIQALAAPKKKVQGSKYTHAIAAALDIRSAWLASGDGEMMDTAPTLPANITRLTPSPDPLIAELLAHAGRMSRAGLARLVERAASLAEQYPAQANPAKSSG